MLDYLKKCLTEEHWLRGSIWEFDWYLDVFFAEVMAYGHYPVYIGYEQPILGDEYLDFAGEGKIMVSYKSFLKDKLLVAKLIHHQRQILKRSDDLIKKLRNGDFDDQEYKVVQKDLSLLMASVSVVFDKLIPEEIKEISATNQINEEDLTNYLVESSSHTKLSTSNNHLLILYKKHTHAINNAKFIFSRLPKPVQQLLVTHSSLYGWLNTGEQGSKEWSPQDFLTQLQNITQSKQKHLEIKIPSGTQRQVAPLVQININDNLAADKQIELDYLFQRYLQARLGRYYLEEVIENLTYEEIQDVLAIPKSISKYAATRKNHWRVVWPEAGHLEFAYFANKQAFDDIYSLVKEAKQTKSIVSGMIACRGTAKGKVRIIRTQKDLESFQAGEVMVAVKTQPKYVMAMSKAAAIITDIGGITSHASIISREFHIPCIVGTENATKILHEGDYVIVDAENGIVRQTSAN